MAYSTSFSVISKSLLTAFEMLLIALKIPYSSNEKEFSSINSKVLFKTSNDTTSTVRYPMSIKMDFKYSSAPEYGVPVMS